MLHADKGMVGLSVLDEDENLKFLFRERKKLQPSPIVEPFMLEGMVIEILETLASSEDGRLLLTKFGSSSF